MTPEQGAKRLQEILQLENVKRVVLVTGKRSFELSGASSALLPLLRESTRLTHFDEVPKNPDTTAVDAAAKACGSAVPDLILAVGGGSAMDLAKGLSVRVSTGRPTHECLDPSTWQDAKLTPVVAIPTTTGTGSEATQFAVIYHQNKKHSFSSPKLLPKHVLLVPAFTLAQPLSVRASSGFDALSQAVESFWSGHGTAESDHAALEAMRLALPRLTLGLQRFDEEVAADMQRASHLAGVAINQTRTTAPHALSYALTTDYGIDHGHAVGLLLPKVWRLHVGLLANGSLPPLLHQRMEVMSKILGEPIPSCPSRLEAMLSINELPYRFQDLGLTSRQNWIELCERVNLDRLRNHPVELSAEAIQGLWDHEITVPQ